MYFFYKSATTRKNAAPAFFQKYISLFPSQAYVFFVIKVITSSMLPLSITTDG